MQVSLWDRHSCLSKSSDIELNLNRQECLFHPIETFWTASVDLGIRLRTATIPSLTSISYFTFSQLSTNLPSAVATILFPSKTTVGGSKGNFTSIRPPSIFTGTVLVSPERL
jgi:hypothetical protein